MFRLTATRAACESPVRLRSKTSTDRSFLHRPQRADEAKECRLARPRWTRHDHELSGTDFDGVLEENLVAQSAVGVAVVDPIDADHRRIFVGENVVDILKDRGRVGRHDAEPRSMPRPSTCRE